MDIMPKAIKQAKRAAYAKLSQAQKARLDVAVYPQGVPERTSHVARVQARQQQISVTDGQVVAELTLGFWKGLYGPKYQQTLWRPALKRTFPNRKVARSRVAAELEAIYQARNRLAHHEPVLHKRFRETVGAIAFVAAELGTRPETGEAPLNLLLRDNSGAGHSDRQRIVETVQCE